MLTVALPKGRLYERISAHLAERGVGIEFKDRKLLAVDHSRAYSFMLVKNSDLPTYVTHGIAGLGICGEDVLYESGYAFHRLCRFDFGTTRMCLAAARSPGRPPGLRIATKYVRFTRDFFHARGLPVQIIRLDGSVELAPVLGLAPYIVDLVETGGTLKAHDLEILETLKEISIYLIANPAYYKVHYKEIDAFTRRVQATKPST